MSERESLIKEISEKPRIITGWFQLLSMIAIVFSIVYAIWFDWELAWKIFATAWVVILVTGFFNLVIKQVVSEAVDTELAKDEDHKPISKFGERLRKLMEEAKENKN